MSTLAAIIPLVDYVMACRFGYYVHAHSYVPDAEYDEMERRAREEAPFDHPVHELGSSNKDDYTHYPSHVRALSLYLRLRESEEGGKCEKCDRPSAIHDTEDCEIISRAKKAGPAAKESIQDGSLF